MENFLNMTRMSNLTAEQINTVEDLVTLASVAVWDATCKNYGVKFENFKHDANCVKYIEDYLNLKVKSRILKWEQNSPNCIQITRVKTLAGVATSNEKHIETIYKIINAVSMLFGQCIANTFDAKWLCKDERFSLDVPCACELYTDWKCIKFVTLGNEDSLLGFMQAITHWENNQNLIDQVEEKIKLIGKYPANCKRQAWTDENGKLVRIVLIDTNTNLEACNIEIATMN